MKREKQDRRSLRTRRLVSDAMLALMREKRYNAITVQDLLDRAGIGRSTFYAHYFDKEDALASVVEQMLESFRQGFAQGESGQALIPSLALFRHAYEQRRFFQTMVAGQLGERLWASAQGLLSHSIEQTLAAARPAGMPTAIPSEVVSHYLTGAFLSLFRWWLEADIPYPPEEMDRLFQRLAMPGVIAASGG
jgi:AcrR family transcriptional regulator